MNMTSHFIRMKISDSARSRQMNDTAAMQLQKGNPAAHLGQSAIRSKPMKPLADLTSQLAPGDIRMLGDRTLNSVYKPLRKFLSAYDHTENIRKFFVRVQ